MIDIDRIKQNLSSNFKSLKLRTRYEFKRFVNSGTDAYDDLKNMIVVDDGRRIMISCRKSSLVFLGNLVVWSFVVCLGFRLLIGLMMWFKGCMGFGTSGGKGIMVRRDRSLGGREVVVAAAKGGDMVKRIESSGSEKDMFVINNGSFSEGIAIQKRVRKEEKLPGWFPVSVKQQPVTAYSEEGQRIAKVLVRGKFSCFIEENFIFLNMVGYHSYGYHLPFQNLKWFGRVCTCEIISL